MLHFLLSISSCLLLCGSFQALTGLSARTALTSVMGTIGKKMCHWNFSHTMQELTVASHFPLPTLRQFHRTKSHRLVSLTSGNSWNVNVDLPSRITILLFFDRSLLLSQVIPPTPFFTPASSTCHPWPRWHWPRSERPIRSSASRWSPPSPTSCRQETKLKTSS